MGNHCTTCNSCGKYDTVEFVFGMFYMEHYQNLGVHVSNLDRYDQFYRVVCNPLHQIKAHDFLDDLEEIFKKLDMNHQVKTVLAKAVEVDRDWYNQKHFVDKLNLD